ncbi:hypothetical protein LXL04_024304 [Taraxacum kok-saghyz]
MSSSSQTESDAYDLVKDLVPPKPSDLGRLKIFFSDLDIVPNPPDCKYFRWVDPVLTNKHYRILLMKMKAICNGEEIARLRNELAGVKEKLEQTEEELFLAQHMHECDKEEAAMKILGLENQLDVLRKKMKRQLIYGTIVVVGTFGLGLAMHGV